MPNLTFTDGKKLKCSWGEFYAAHLTKDTPVICTVLRGTDQPEIVVGNIVRFWYALNMLHVDIEAFGGAILTIKPGPLNMGKDKLRRVKDAVATD